MLDIVYCIVTGLFVIGFCVKKFLDVLFYKKIKAICIQNGTNSFNRSRFTFQLDGVQITSQEDVYPIKRKEGSEYTIFVNPKKPEKIITFSQLVIMAIITVGFTALEIVVFSFA